MRLFGLGGVFLFGWLAGFFFFIEGMLLQILEFFKLVLFQHRGYKIQARKSLLNSKSLIIWI